MEEYKNPVSIISKRTYVYRANRPFKNPIHQNKGFKRIESFRPFNRCKKSNKGSSYNIHFEDDEESSKDVETELELELELQSFTYIIGDFDLDNDKSSCFISFWSSKDNAKNVENIEIEGGYFATFNKSNKLLKRSLNRPDLLLYDIGTTDYIVNNKK